MVSNDVAAVAVHREWNDRVVETFPVVVQIEQGVNKGVAQAFLVQRLVGISDVESVF